MMSLIVGGAACGKSQYAESLLARCGAPRFYIATLQPLDEESRQRVRRHRCQRAGKGFATIEQDTDLDRLTLPADGSALLECLGTLLANEMYRPDGGAAAEQRILRGLAHLQAQCRQLIVVSNCVHQGGRDYEGDTLSYLRALGRLNRALAARADRVCEMVCGIPVYHKGGER